jgi:hypothetical protein
MMRQLFASAAITAALCSLAISVAPALGYEFHGDRTTMVTAVSHTTQIFQLGASDWVECTELEAKFTPELTGSPKLKLKLTYPPSTCVYNHPSESQIVSETHENCPVALKSTALKKAFGKEFDEGLLSLECNLRFKTRAGCEIAIKEHITPLLSEFEWRDEDTVSGDYESHLLFRLEKMEYTVTGLGCGSSGTNGEYNGSIFLDGVIVE